MIEATIERWHKEAIEEGMRIGEEKGIANQKKILLEMFSDRFGEIPQSWKKAIDDIDDINAIGRLIREVYRVKSTDEFGDMLAGKTAN